MRGVEHRLRRPVYLTLSDHIPLQIFVQFVIEQSGPIQYRLDLNLFRNKMAKFAKEQLLRRDLTS